MERVTFSIPTLFADHHVLKLRQALLDVDGVQNVIASSMYRDVTIDFDAATTSAEALQQVVEGAGYPIGVEPEFTDLVPAHEDASPWFTLARRVTTTNRQDLEMSGDFRKY